MPQLRWIVGSYPLVAENATATCVSDEAPSDAHPADSTFYCESVARGEQAGKQKLRCCSVERGWLPEETTRSKNGLVGRTTRRPVLSRVRIVARGRAPGGVTLSWTGLSVRFVEKRLAYALRVLLFLLLGRQSN